MKLILSAVVIVSVCFAAGCSSAEGDTNLANKMTPANAPTPPAAKTGGPFASVPRISLEEAKRDFDAGTAVFVDTHSESTYAAQHIRGAINIPINDIESNLDKLPKGKKIIAYCS